MIVIKIILWILLAVFLIVFLALAIPVRASFIYNSSEMKLIVKYLFLKFPIDFGSDEEAEEKSEKKKSENNQKINKTAEERETTISKKTVSEEQTVIEEKTTDRNGSTKKPENKKKDKKKAKSKKNAKEENKVLQWFKITFKERGLNGLISVLKEIAGLAVTFLKPVFKHIKLRNLDMNITVAFEDAADTAVRYGYACAAIYPSLAVILKIVKYKKYNVNIAPDFDKKQPEIDLAAEISLVPWFVVFGAVHAFVNYLVLRSKGKL